MVLNTHSIYKFKMLKSVHTITLLNNNTYRQFLSSRSGDGDLEQLAYAETKCACLKTLQHKIEMEGVPIKDEMKFCKGDGPSLQLETGNQRVDIITALDARFMLIAHVSSTMHFTVPT